MVCLPDRLAACSLGPPGSGPQKHPLTTRQPHVADFMLPRQQLARLATFVCACSIALVATAADTALQYNRDVRPILFENCLSCHGPDSASRQADLRLDKREVAVEKKAIVPGKPDQSEMIRRILSDDGEEQMPPPATKKKLTDAQKQILAKWIKEGAAYQPHWSLIAPVRPPVPH